MLLFVVYMPDYFFIGKKSIILNRQVKIVKKYTDPQINIPNNLVA